MAKKLARTNMAGFYVSTIAAAFSFIASIVYVCVYHNSRYMSWLVFGLLVSAAVLFIPLVIFQATRAWAPVATGGIAFIAFIAFIRYTYLVLSEIFFGGSIGNVGAFVAFLFSVLLMLGSVILSNVGIYKIREKEQPDAELREAEVKEAQA